MPVVSLHLRSVASQISIQKILLVTTISHGEVLRLAERLSALSTQNTYEVSILLLPVLPRDIAVSDIVTRGYSFTPLLL